jgi:hypothetical protein
MGFLFLRHFAQKPFGGSLLIGKLEELRILIYNRKMPYPEFPLIGPPPTGKFGYFYTLPFHLKRIGTILPFWNTTITSTGWFIS